MPASKRSSTKYSCSALELRISVYRRSSFLGETMAVAHRPGRRGLFLPHLVADLILDDLAQGDIFGRQLFEGFHQRTIAALQLLHAARNHVDQDVRIGNFGQRLFDVIVSHSGRWLSRKREHRLAPARGRQSKRIKSLSSAPADSPILPFPDPPTRRFFPCPSTKASKAPTVSFANAMS